MQKWLSFIKAGSRKSNDNKRANPRLDVYHLAKYKLVSDQEDRSPTIAHIKNISGGGICLHAK